MKEKQVEDYPTLYQFFGAYLNQDADLIADTIGGVLANFVEENSDETVALLRGEAAQFLREHEADLDHAFDRLYGFGFSPALAGYSTKSFLEWLIANAHR
jgi:hypothetical protein